MNHESEVLDKNVLFYIFGYILRYPEQAIWSISGEAHVSFEIPSKAKNSLCSRSHARVPGTVDFSLFTPIRVPYYLRAVDTRVSGIDFSDSQRTDYKSRACKCAFYRADSSKCSSRRRRLRNARKVHPESAMWEVDVCGIRGTSLQKRRFKYKVNYISTRFHQR